MQNAQFLRLMDRMIPEGQLRTLCRHFEPTPRTARKLSTEQLVTALVFHQLQPGGTLADHSARLHGTRMSDSACAQRRQNLPVELFEQIMDSALGPLATPAHHPDSFFEGYRLLGIDGTQWRTRPGGVLLRCCSWVNRVHIGCSDRVLCTQCVLVSPKTPQEAQIRRRIDSDGRA